MPRKRKLIDEPSSTPKGKSSKSKREDDKLPLLTLPTELLFRIFCHLDYATRRALRGNGKLAAIEKQTKYRCNHLKVTDSEEDVRIVFDDAEVRIPHSEVAKEFELMKENTIFNEVNYTQIGSSVDRRSLDEVCLIKTKTMRIGSPLLNDRDLESLVKNSELVFVRKSDVTGDGILRIHEQMRHYQRNATITRIFANDANHLWSILEKFGTFDRATLQFTSTNPNQQALDITGTTNQAVMIIENDRKIVFLGINENSDEKMVVLF